jgi:hypothetical protein
MPNQVSSILRLHAAMTGGGGEDASCLGAGIVDIGVGTALAAKQAVKIEGDEVLDVDGAVGSPDHETTRSVPPYNFGGTLSARGATCAMRTLVSVSPQRRDDHPARDACALASCRLSPLLAHNESRIHRSLSKDAPFPRAIERLGVITSRPVLGGLHHQYCRI